MTPAIAPPVTAQPAAGAVLYAWEFGANLGHIGTFLPVARELRAHGRPVHWAVVHPHQAARLLPRAGFTWLQAPTIPEQRRDGMPLNYADILLRYGYANADDLLGLVVAWRELMLLTGCRVVLADHAPTAILAARSLGLPVMLFGSGFFAPPQRHPTPNMRPWLPVAEEQLLACDVQALAAMNRVLTHFDAPPLATVAELFRVAEDTLLTFPELDHYPERGPARYWGTLPAAVAEPPQWPDPVAPNAPGPRIYAYLRPETPHLEAVLAALRALPATVLIFAPGLPAELAGRYAAPHLRFAAAPVDLTSAARDAVLAVTYASPAATIAFLMAGKPVLMIPMHLEQYLLARRVEGMGAGLMLHPEQPPADLAARLQHLLDAPGPRDNAAAFAAKYARFDQDQVMRHIVGRIEELALLPASQGTP